MKTENIYEENAKNVRISEETRALITCMAKLNDAYATICNTVEEVYGVDTEKLYMPFVDAYINMDKGLRGIIADVIGTTASDSEYREI